MKYIIYLLNRKNGKTDCKFYYQDPITLNFGKTFNLNEIILKNRVDILNQIWFEEDIVYGYASRTVKNATADLTLAFAYDFNSAGECLTKTSVYKQENYYIPIRISSLMDIKEGIVTQIKEFITSIYEEKGRKISINIAGNGIYTFLEAKFLDIKQEDLDNFIYNYFKEIFTEEIINKVYLIRSGGQTGVDEAGIKAAFKLQIPTLLKNILLPFVKQI